MPFHLDTAPGLALALEDLASRHERSRFAPRRLRRSAFPFLLPWGSFPLRRSQPGKSTPRRAPTPASLARLARLSGSVGCVSNSPSSRDSIPASLRLRCFYSLDGFLLPRPGDLFQPRTSLGFLSPSRSLAPPLPKEPPDGEHRGPTLLQRILRSVSTDSPFPGVEFVRPTSAPAAAGPGSASPIAPSSFPAVPPKGNSSWRGLSSSRPRRISPRLWVDATCPAVFETARRSEERLPRRTSNDLAFPSLRHRCGHLNRELSPLQAVSTGRHP